jgi:hypothetical protein
MEENPYSNNCLMLHVQKKASTKKKKLKKKPIVFKDKTTNVQT